MRERVIVLTLILLGITINSQGRRDAQSWIHAEYGIMPGQDDLSVGPMAKLGYGKVIGSKGILGKAEAFYHNYSVEMFDQQFLPYQKYGLNVAAGYSYEGLFPVLLNGWAGAYGAYEQVNNGNTRSPLYSSVIPGDIKGFIYGLSGSAELEIFLAKKVSLLVNYTQYYDLKSSFSRSNYGVFGGLKYSFN